MSRYRAFIILLLDVLIIFLCNFLTMLPYLLGQDIRLLNLVLHIGLLTVCVLLFQVCLKTYDTLWRYAESREYLTLLEGMGLGFTLYSVVNLLLDTSRIWISSALMGTALALLVMLGYRFVYRSYRRRVTGVGGGPRAYAAIIGAGSAGAALVSEMDDRIYGRYRPYCVIDDAAEKQQKRIHGVPVLGPIDAMEEILADTPVTDIILAIQNLTPERRQEILNLCARTQRRVHVLGSPVTRLHARQGDYIAAVREVEIEDLLGRAPVQLENPRIGTFLRGKTVLVTGGGGSIGSELCRQIAANRPERLVILDVAENTTYELQNDLLHWYGEDFPLSVEIASVRDRQRLEQIFAKYRPQLVFHAAAHKHVPLMEGCPEEAVENNVFGTFNTADMARRYGAEKFVLISTDKAVNPTNIMGATKNLCEEVLQGLRGVGGTEFAAVRFGNVLGSSGSVIPLFKKQISYGGPVTLTDRRIIRYFMTIPEAAQLVLEAGSFARSGEVFVLNMGEPVRIFDLAEKLIRLSGFVPGADIEIREVGLRPGEKLYEELLMSNEKLKSTENEKIFVEERPAIPEKELRAALEELQAAIDAGNRAELLRLMHALVPTFRAPEEVNREAQERLERKAAI